MAFPVVEATAISDESAGTTSHTIAMPTGIVSGEKLVMLLSWQGVGFLSDPSGWTKLNPPGNLDNTVSLRLYHRTADGTEGSSVTTSSSATLQSCHLVYRISGWGSIEGSTGATGTSGLPDCDALTPSGGAADYLWLGMLTSGGADNFSSSSPPANYTNEIVTKSGITAGYSFRRELNASTEDPGSVTTTSDDWAAATVAIAPEATTPSAPTGVTASNATATTIDLSWTDTNGGTANPRMYKRLTGTGPGNWTFVEQLATTETTYTFTGLPSGTQHDLGVSYAN